MQFALAIVVNRRFRTPASINGNFSYARPRFHNRAFADRLAQMSDIRGGFRSDGTAEHALTVQTAGRPSVVVARNDRVVGRPPVPSQVVEALCDGFAQHANRSDRSWPRRSADWQGLHLGQRRPNPNRSGRSRASIPHERSANRRRPRPETALVKSEGENGGSVRPSGGCCRQRH